MQEITDKTVGDIVSTATLHISNEVYWVICVIYANKAKSFYMGNIFIRSKQ